VELWTCADALLHTPAAADEWVMIDCGQVGGGGGA
jgi:hypothetical protein